MTGKSCDICGTAYVTGASIRIGLFKRVRICDRCWTVMKMVVLKQIKEKAKTDMEGAKI